MWAASFSSKVLLCVKTSEAGFALAQGLQDVIGLSVTHPTWQRTRPDDPKDEHTGWTFASPDDPPFSSPTGWHQLASRTGADAVQLTAPVGHIPRALGTGTVTQQV